MTMRRRETAAAFRAARATVHGMTTRVLVERAIEALRTRERPATSAAALDRARLLLDAARAARLSPTVVGELAANFRTAAHAYAAA